MNNPSNVSASSCNAFTPAHQLTNPYEEDRRRREKWEKEREEYQKKLMELYYAGEHQKQQARQEEWYQFQQRCNRIAACY